MGIHIVVFVDKPPTQKQTNLVKVIQKSFPVMVDAIHNEATFFETNFPNGRFFFASEFLSICTVEELNGITPDFVVSFNEDFKVSEKQWISISRYFENLLFPEFNHTDVIEEATALLSQFVVIHPDAIDKQEESITLKEHYELFTHHNQERDVMLIQVEKPFCDLPYTVVIRNYSQKGLRSFFTDLFICDSWGVSRKDFEFLEQVWKHFKMEGDYNLDQMLREATKRCFPQEGVQPESEPEVYRRPIENVLDTFQKRENGVNVINADLWNQQRLKKRKLEDALLIN